MGLPAHQRRVLDRIEDTLRKSDPQLAAMFAVFARLTRDEEIPPIERLRHRAALVGTRIGLWLTAAGRRLRVRRLPGRHLRRQQGTRRWVAVFFPLALVLSTLAIVVVARLGATPRCATVAPVATAKPHPRGKPVTKSTKSKLCASQVPGPRPLSR